MTPIVPAADTRAPSFTSEEKDKYVINRQDKDYVLYAGLLMLLHRINVSKIETKLLQIPTQDNGQCAIVQAWVTVEHGTFSGIGDATPGNVNRMMANAIIRMAETRAKARAARDAVNASAWALNDDVDDDIPPTVRPTVADARREFEAMLAGHEQQEAIKSYGLALLPNGESIPLIDGKPVPRQPSQPMPIKDVIASLRSLKPEPSPRERSLIQRGATPVDEDVVPDLKTALAKWAATIKLANGLGIRIPVMTDKQMSDPMELQSEGRKLSRAITMKQTERNREPQPPEKADQHSGA